MISENRDLLPVPKDLWKRCLGVAVLDAALATDVAFSLHRERGAVRFRYDHRSGDHVEVWFVSDGPLILGFDHESSLSPYGDSQGVAPGVITGLPAPLRLTPVCRAIAAGDPVTDDDLQTLGDVAAARALMAEFGYGSGALP